MQYAKTTSVSSAKSKAEIERTLVRYGASSFMYGWDGVRAVVQFIFGDKQIRFHRRMPDREDKKYTHSKRGRRTEDAIGKLYEQDVRQRWRSLLLSIKARLEEVSSGAESFDEAFMGKIVLPNGQTIADWILPQIDKVCVSGNMPKLLPAPQQEANIIDAEMV